MRRSPPRTCVHSHASHRGPDIEPPASSGFAQLPVLVHDVAGDANGCASILADPAYFAALQPDSDKLARHHLGAVFARFFFLGYDSRIGSSAAAEDGGAIRPGSHVEYNRPHRNHVHGQAVPSPGRFCRENTGIDDSSHAVKQLLWNTSTVALHHIPGSHALGCHDVALLARRLLGQQCDMGAPAGIILDSLDEMRPWRPPVKVDSTDSPLVATSAMPDRDAASVIPPALPLSLLGDRQWKMWPTLPQVVVDGSFEMPSAGCPRFVGSHHDLLDGGRRCAKRTGATSGCILSIALRRCRIRPDDAEAKGTLAEGGCPRSQGAEPRLQHGRGLVKGADSSETGGRKPAPTGCQRRDIEAIPVPRWICKSREQPIGCVDRTGLVEWPLSSSPRQLSCVCQLGILRLWKFALGHQPACSVHPPARSVASAFRLDPLPRVKPRPHPARKTRVRFKPRGSGKAAWRCANQRAVAPRLLLLIVGSVEGTHAFSLASPCPPEVPLTCLQNSARPPASPSSSSSLLPPEKFDGYLHFSGNLLQASRFQKLPTGNLQLACCGRAIDVLRAAEQLCCRRELGQVPGTCTQHV